MAISVVGFENVQVLKVGVTGPAPANTLFLVTGVVIVNYHGPLNDFNRDSVTFFVPEEDETDPDAPALNIGHFVESSAIAYPVAIEASTERPVGWAVDSVDTAAVGNNFRVTARLAALNPGSTIIRIGFQANILSRT
ncbi:MAG: hypothetical protein E6J34_08235 [Chloroflexi bacterium]|nr:MAG: hypothetical protein E6J34_08235 [Chloroflexota bacterium]